MSHNEVGKTAKRLGVAVHRDRRALDPVPVPAKLPGSTKKHGKVRKCFGFKYEWRWGPSATLAGERNPWRQRNHWGWYATERQRDDAMRTTARNSGFEIRKAVPIQRK